MAGVAGKSGGGNRSMSVITPPPTKVKGKLVSPDWYILGETKTLEEIHGHIAKKLKNAGVTESIDSTLVASLAQQYQFLQDCSLAYATDGPGALIGRALASRLIGEAHAEIYKILKEFQVTPSTRNKADELAAPESTGDTALDNLFNFTH